MMISRFIRLVSSSLIVFLLNGCFQSEYTKLVNRELAKGVRYDSVLLGIKFGDSPESFRDKCSELNRNHMVMEAASYWVRYIHEDSTMMNPAKMDMIFLPIYDERGILAGLDMKFSYAAWAPWNKDLQSDHLQNAIKNLLMKWYKGNGFVSAHVGEKDVPVKVDGNRRIMIYDSPPQHIIVRVQNILHPMFSHK